FPFQCAAAPVLYTLSLHDALPILEIAQVNLPVGILIWVMIIPMLLKVDFGALGQVKQHWRGIGVTLFINWAVKPFSMAFLGWLLDRKSTRLNSSHVKISYAVFCLK